MTRFVRIISITAIVILLLGFIAWSQSNYSESNVGKYQLFQGTYIMFNFKNVATDETRGIFKIDTKTGKVWVYIAGLDKDGDSFTYWIETWKPND